MTRDEYMRRGIVREGYNKIAESYSAQRDEFKNLPYVERLRSLLPRSSRILDVGCGAGVPIDRYLIVNGHSVTGIDISERQIELAQKNVPQGVYAVKDMSELQSGEYQVDAVISFYAIFHLPREVHQELFRKFNTFLHPGGLILVTMGSSEWEGEAGDFHGGRMYWSHYGPEKNREIIEEAGFNILFDEIDTSGGERHQVILSEKVQNMWMPNKTEAAP